MNLSVCISTMGRPHTLHRILKCLKQQTIKIDEIIIIEASGYSWDISLFPVEGVRVIYMKGLSLSDARKFCVDISRSEYIAFLDDDIIIKDNYLSVAIDFLDECRTYNGVGGCYEDCITQNRSEKSISIGKLFNIYGEGNSNRIINSGWADYVRNKATEKETDAEWLFGCNGVYRKLALAELEYNEELIKWSFLEDVLLGTKLTRKFGVNLKILPSMKVIHDPEETSGAYNKQTLRMRVLYRHLYFRDFVENGNVYKYLISIIGNIILLLKCEVSIKNLVEISRVYKKLFTNWNSLNWKSVNEYIIKKD